MSDDSNLDDPHLDDPHFDIEDEPFSHGGMGDIYAALDRKLHRKVAIKFINRRHFGNQEAELRLLKEAQVLAQLSCNKVVEIYHIGQFRRGPGIVMEFIDGETLEEHILSGKVPVDRCLETFQQISLGLAFIHKKDILHRDLTARNIMIDREGTAKLLDFGLAKYLSTHPLVTIDNKEQMSSGPNHWGTPQFMSPEQTLGRPLDEKSDLFSLGVVFYYALTGEFPFYSEDTAEMFRKIRSEEPVALKQHRNDIPVPLQDLVLSLLEKEPRQRPRDALQISEEIQAILSPRSADKTDPIPMSDWVDHYVYRLKAAHQTIPVPGFRTSSRMPIRIHKIYVPLRAAILREQASDLNIKDELEQEIALQDLFRRQDLGSRRGAVIHGGPGSGKTTFLKYLIQKTTHETGLQSLGLPRDTIPVFLELRSLDRPGDGLENALKQAVNGDNMRLPQKFVNFLFRYEHLLLMVDGLDEISDDQASNATVRWLKKALEQFPQSLIVVTSRFPRGARNKDFGPEFVKLELRSLKEDEARQFIHTWYDVAESDANHWVEADSSEHPSRTKAEELCCKIFDRDLGARGLQELASNPLLLQCLCQVHRDRKTLPKQRSALYDECIRGLLDLRRSFYRLPFELDQTMALKFLQPLAFYLQRRGLHRATFEEIEPHLKEPLRALRLPTDAASSIINAIQDQTGILKTSRDGKLEFLHLIFQYFLAARHIQDQRQNDPSLLELAANNFKSDWWREVILLAVSFDTSCPFQALMEIVTRRFQLSSNPTLVTECLETTAEMTARPALECLGQVEPGGSGSTPSAEETMELLKFLDHDSFWKKAQLGERSGEEVVEKLALAHADGRVRARAGELLGQSHSDFMINPRDGMEMVRVPNGKYTLGTKFFHDSQPKHEIELSSFWIGRYPVTNREYDKYLQANPNARRPRFSRDNRFNGAQQPVVGISWDEASDYCRWAGLQLPTEAQWEAAARSRDGLRFPWGDEEPTDLRANFGGLHGRTTAVRAHFTGIGPHGTWDQAGNVWEWCQDVWNPHAYSSRAGAKGPVQLVGDDTQRVIRGGSWKNQSWVLASAYRLRHGFGARESDIGFRCVKCIDHSASPEDDG